MRHVDKAQRTKEAKMKRTGKVIMFGFPLLVLLIWTIACYISLAGQVFKSHANYTYMDMHHFIGVHEFIEVAHGSFPYMVALAVLGGIVGLVMILVARHREGLSPGKR